MNDAVACEYCGRVTPAADAIVMRVDGWPRHFCSEKCKVVWGEHAALDDGEEGE